LQPIIDGLQGVCTTMLVRIMPFFNNAGRDALNQSMAPNYLPAQVQQSLGRAQLGIGIAGVLYDLYITIQGLIGFVNGAQSGLNSVLNSFPKIPGL
jgi:hypothetical protein